MPTDSTKVPNKLIDDCIHYKADAEFYQNEADSTAFQNVELKVRLKEIESDKYKWFGAGWLGATITAGLIFILAR